MNEHQQKNPNSLLSRRINFSSFLHHYNPAVPRHWLFAFAGILWITVGLLLCTRAISWLVDDAFTTSVAIEFAGVVIAIPVYRFGFSRIVRKNIFRIEKLPDHACAFALMAWRGYLMIALMVTIGLTLRNSAIPKHYLSLPYTTMGIMLLEGSIGFFRHFLRLVSSKAEQ